MPSEPERPSGGERRQHRRAEIRLEAVLLSEKKGEEIQLTVRNFSVGGFLCTLGRPIQPMTRLQIGLEFPPFGDQPAREISAVALVVRCERPSEPGGEYRVAACFLQLPQSTREHLEAYIDWNRRARAAA
jgi:c-di-GMP-binding flagellar brake protein YcgR